MRELMELDKSKYDRELQTRDYRKLAMFYEISDRFQKDRINEND